ncbi:hypothetical protein C1Y40_01478 [Mycobacterium talmoniae]|uniref:Enoyl-CoA hydratase n=1 Tax=Mycobacterium talmoniae TaxID=1858794 RepID=A0A1S1NGV6_9MYCO|nr:hypothetical protein BKN37_17045 [Mycobacterium talmoniae]PQM48306.1 hypothetical protein C1Y40_01478 [Mycobacterium talmoniae]
MLRALVAAAKQINEDRDVRAVLLQPAGQAFCTGLDFAVFRDESMLSQPRAADKWLGRRTKLFREAV